MPSPSTSRFIRLNKPHTATASCSALPSLLRNMIYAYPTLHRAIEDALRSLAHSTL
jgi:hypothetical protein